MSNTSPTSFSTKVSEISFATKQAAKSHRQQKIRKISLGIVQENIMLKLNRGLYVNMEGKD